MLKVKYIILAILISTIYLNGASLKFANNMNYETSYKKAIAKAKEANKPIMMVIGTKTCPWCRKLENQTLKKDTVNNVVSKEFIPLTLTRGLDKYPKQFDAKVVPTVFFIDPNNQKAYHVSYGYKNKNIFEDIVKKAAVDFKKGIK